MLASASVGSSPTSGTTYPRYELEPVIVVVVVPVQYTGRPVPDARLIKLRTLLEVTPA